MKTLYDGRDFRCSVTFFPPPLSLSLSCARAVPSIPSDGANNSQTVAIAPVSLTPTSFYGHHPRGQVESFLLLMLTMMLTTPNRCYSFSVSLKNVLQISDIPFFSAFLHNLSPDSVAPQQYMEPKAAHFECVHSTLFHCIGLCVCAYERQTKLSLLLRLLSSFSCGYSYWTAQTFWKG